MKVRAPRVAVPAALLVFAACARTPEPPAARTLTLGLEAPIRSLDPATDDSVTWSVLGNVFEGLVTVGPQLTIEASLATRWSNPDELTWIFHLRPGVRFHDGTPLDAAAVRDGLDRVRVDRASPARLWLSAVESVEADGPGRVVVRTRRPDPLLLAHLAQVPIAKGATSEAVDRAPIGSGPYRVRLRSAARIELEAWTGWWGPPVKVPRLDVVVAGDGEAALKALDDGKVDLAGVPMRTVMRAPNPRWRWSDAVGLSTMFLWVDSRPRANGRNPFADLRVRRALSLAVDGRAAARAGAGHDDTLSTQLVPRLLFGFDPKLKRPAFDPAAARALLAEAGYARGFDTVLTFRGAEATRAVAASIQASLASVGIRASGREVSAEGAGAAYRGEPQALFLDSWTFDVADASSFLQDCVRTRDEAAGVGLLNPGFSDPEIDALVDRSVTTLDPSRRAPLLSRALALAQERVPAIPLYDVPRIWGVARDVAWAVRLDGRLFGTEMAFRAPPTPKPARSPRTEPRF